MIRRLFSLILAGVLAAALSLSVFASGSPFVCIFDGEESLSAVIPNAAEPVTVSYDNVENAMKVAGTISRGYFTVDISAVFGDVDCGVYKYLAVRAKADDISRQFAVLYTTDENPNIGDNGDYHDCNASFFDSGAYENLIFDFSAKTSYTGKLTSLRFDPWFYEGENKVMYIEAIGIFATYEEAEAFTGEKAVTEAPVTEAPVTEAPVTEAPITDIPDTSSPATADVVISAAAGAVLFAAAIAAAQKRKSR